MMPKHNNDQTRTSKQSRTRRRFLTGVGAAGAVALAGCSGDGGSGGGDGGSTGGSGGSGDIELSYRTLFGGGDGEIMKAMVDDFNENQPIDGVTISRQRTPWDEHYNQLFTSMSGGNPPDMAISHASFIRRFQENLVDLTDYISDNNYNQAIWNAVTVDGSQWAVPMDSHPTGLYYNQDILDQAGVETPFTSFSQFEEACNAIMENTDAMPFSPDPYWGGGGGFRQWFMGLRQYGGSMFNDDNSEVTFDETGGLESLEYLASIPGERGWDKADTSEDRVTQAFANGDIAMTVNGTWYVTVMSDVDFNWGFSKPHVFPDADQLATTADSHTIIVPAGADRSDERVQKTVETAEYLTQEYPRWGAEAGHLPAYNPILEGDALRESPYWEKTLSKYMEMANDDQLAYWPQLAGTDLYAGSNWTWITDTYGGNISAQQGIQNAVSAWQSNV